MPTQFTQYQMVWIPKPNKDQRNIKNLRPINLIHPLAKVLYTYMPLNKKQVFEKILREYKFKEGKIKGPDGKPYISFFIEV
jgi:hypothetical protein